MNFLFTNFCVLYIALFLFYFAVCARVFVPMAAHLCHSVLLLDREILMKKKNENVALKNGTPRSKYTGFSFYYCAPSLYSLILGGSFSK